MSACVCLGIIPPVSGGGVTLNRSRPGVAECTNSFNSHVCYRHAAIVSIMDGEERPASSFNSWIKHSNQADQCHR